MFWFVLWREFKLSIAEVLSQFSNSEIIWFEKDILILDKIWEKEILEKWDFLWWTIKIIKLNRLDEENIEDLILKKAKLSESKFNYSLNSYWEKINLKNKLLEIKKKLKSENFSSRFVNKDFKNLNSAQIIWEKLVKKASDFNYIKINSEVYFWYTIKVQDINAYSKRDYSKNRDMQTGMLPPKLAQMMINIIKKENTIWVYDPFVWLATVLIEAINMWYKNIYWSDINKKMIDYSQENIKSFTKEKGISLDNFFLETLNAKFISESEILINKKDINIVSEWYLWEVMTKKNISLERINKQKESLLSIYSKFFSELQKISFSWNIIICFPFWEISWKYYFFEEVYEIIKKYSSIEKFFPESVDLKETKAWSLLYKREKQLVWRELFKLKIKSV